MLYFELEITNPIPNYNRSEFFFATDHLYNQSFVEPTIRSKSRMKPNESANFHSINEDDWYEKSKGVGWDLTPLMEDMV